MMRKYSFDYYHKHGKKKKLPPQETKPIKPVKLHTDFIGGYEAEKKMKETAEQALEKVKEQHGEITIIKIPELHNATFEVKGKLSQKEIAAFKAGKIQKEKEKLENLKK